MNPRHADSDAFGFLWNAITSNPLAALAAIVAVSTLIAFATLDYRKSRVSQREAESDSA